MHYLGYVSEQLIQGDSRTAQTRRTRRDASLATPRRRWWEGIARTARSGVDAAPAALTAHRPRRTVPAVTTMASPVA